MGSPAICGFTISSMDKGSVAGLFCWLVLSLGNDGDILM